MNRPDYVLGIDPGLGGALALVRVSNKTIEGIFDMPVTVGRVDPAKLAGIVEMCKLRGSIIAAVENVSSMPRQAHAFSFGLSTGIVHGCFGALGVPFELLAPSVWKPACGLRRLTTESQADTKTKARNLAMKLFPENADLFRLVKWDGRAESALIARFFCVKNGWL